MRYTHIDGRTSDDLDDLIPAELTEENERYEYAVRYIEVADEEA